MGNGLKVSVIVPVYRSREWIGRCLDSLLKQSLQEIEVILVDDHGDDDSLSIARAIGDARIRYAATPRNMGPAAARNVGIELAQGEYVTFCDADDWVEENMYEKLYRLATEADADMASAAAVMDYPNGDKRVLHNPRLTLDRPSFDPRSTHGQLTGDPRATKVRLRYDQGETKVRLRSQDRRFILRHFVSNFTTTFFRREWLLREGLRFPDSRSGEDSAFMACCYLMAERVAQTDEALYHYVIHEDSLSHKKHVWRGREKQRAFAEMWRFARAKGRLKPYFFTISWVYLKKAIAMSIVDYIKSFV